MGRLKEKLLESNNLSSIEKYLLLLGFCYEEYVAGSNKKGYQKKVLKLILSIIRTFIVILNLVY